MRLEFTKMEGAGNDFVVLDCSSSPFSLTALQLRKIADRHFGVGCDQILVVERPRRPDADFRYRIFNADGGEVEQCGNGARCFVKFVHARGLLDSPVQVQARGGTLTVAWQGGDNAVWMKGPAKTVFEGQIEL